MKTEGVFGPGHGGTSFTSPEAWWGETLSGPAGRAQAENGNARAARLAPLVFGFDGVSPHLMKLDLMKLRLGTRARILRTCETRFSKEKPAKINQATL
jgi:hypothetical protein